MNKLRPIGTRFVQHFPPDINSTNPYAHDITYEVVKHVQAARFYGDKDGYMAEEVRVIDVMEVEPEWMKTGVFKVN